MELQFKVSPQDRKYATNFFEKWKDHLFVQSRRERNLDGVREPLSRELFWEALVGALLTTQQRAGPGAPINRFLNLTPTVDPIV